MKVYCTKQNEEVGYEKKCIYCPYYDECNDRPGGERIAGILFIIIFLILVVTGAVAFGA